ncbi:hypothetical protein KKG58_04910 [Patescibacteria group bacterium]|nr:hypothetical protein [Patescibacteria group bacterium]
MNPGKWENLIFLAEEKFGIDKKYKEDFEVTELSTGQKIMGQRQIVEFESPLGRIKLEKNSRPKVIDKKVLHTKRIGGRVAIDFVYSDEEKVEELKIYKENADGGWEELSGLEAL